MSLHSAGHILGSSQVRIEHEGRVWVISGDYKRQPDPTCAPFEPVECDVFISEATFCPPGLSLARHGAGRRGSASLVALELANGGSPPFCFATRLARRNEFSPSYARSRTSPSMCMALLTH